MYYHILTPRDLWCGTEGQWVTKGEIDELTEALCAEAESGLSPDTAKARIRLRRHNLEPCLEQAACMPPSFHEYAKAELRGGEKEWRLAHEGAPTPEADAARLNVLRLCAEEWAPRMAYPHRVEENAIAMYDLRAKTQHHPPDSISYLRGGTGPDGKQRMSACASEVDKELGLVDPASIDPGRAAEIHALHEKRAGRLRPTPRYTTDAAIASCGLFETATRAQRDCTLADPLRAPFVRIDRLERPTAEGILVLGPSGQVAVAKMSTKERSDIKPQPSLLAYTVFEQAAASLPDGAHMVRVGDGAHRPDPEDRSRGLATAYAVFKQDIADPVERRELGKQSSKAGAVLPTPASRLVVAYGGCLGPGSSIDTGLNRTETRNRFSTSSMA